MEILVSNIGFLNFILFQNLGRVAKALHTDGQTDKRSNTTTVVGQTLGFITAL